MVLVTLALCSHLLKVCSVSAAAPMQMAHMIAMRTAGSDENGMPETIQLDFRIGGGVDDGAHVGLNLTINSHVRSKAPVYVGRGNSIQRLGAATLNVSTIRSHPQCGSHHGKGYVVG